MGILEFVTFVGGSKCATSERALLLAEFATLQILVGLATRVGQTSGIFASTWGGHVEISIKSVCGEVGVGDTRHGLAAC